MLTPNNVKQQKLWNTKKKLKKGFNFNGVSLIISTCEDLGVTMMINDDVNNR